MKLLSLSITEITKEYIFFKVTIEKGIFFKKKKDYDLFKPINGHQSRFIQDGRSIFYSWTELDKSINAILTTASKHYNSK